MSNLDLVAKAEIPRSLGHDMVLVISLDGVVCDVLQAPTTNVEDPVSNLNGSSVDALWPNLETDRFKRLLKRTVRSRQVQCFEADNETDEQRSEFIIVPYGRDRAIVIVRDVSDHRKSMEKMQQLAYVDEATKLPNREFLLEELRACIEKLLLTEGRAAVLCFEIDRMDSNGIRLSSRDLDEVLKELGARFMHELRGANQPDAISYERYSVAARIDFRRFGVVLPNIERGEDAEGVANRLSESIEQPIKIGNRNISVIAKAGISLYPQDGTDPDALFENSIVAMEDAWNDQHAQVKFHSGTVKLRALQRQDLEQELKTALDREELVLNFLPIIEAKTNKVATIESLLRWPQTTLGTQSVQKIVSIAEHTGLILPIGEWVLRKSCEQLLRWHELGHRDLRIAVNISAQEFSRNDLIDRLRIVLDETSLDPKFLEIEINEYMLFRDAMKDYKTCGALKELGARVIIDDYGTGACSLAHLSRSPVDGVKIDNSFVTHSETVPSDRSACAAVVAMTHQLNMQVTAEGVENENQAKMLRELGCDYLQGFLFSKPESAEEISDFLANSLNHSSSK